MAHCFLNGVWPCTVCVGLFIEQRPRLLKCPKSRAKGGGIIDSGMDPLAAMTCAGDTQIVCSAARKNVESTEVIDT